MRLVSSSSSYRNRIVGFLADVGRIASQRKRTSLSLLLHGPIWIDKCGDFLTKNKGEVTRAAPQLPSRNAACVSSATLLGLELPSLLLLERYAQVLLTRNFQCQIKTTINHSTTLIQCHKLFTTWRVCKTCS